MLDFFIKPKRYFSRFDFPPTADQNETLEQEVQNLRNAAKNYALEITRVETAFPDGDFKKHEEYIGLKGQLEDIKKETKGIQKDDWQTLKAKFNQRIYIQKRLLHFAYNFAMRKDDKYRTKMEKLGSFGDTSQQEGQEPESQAKPQAEPVIEPNITAKQEDDLEIEKARAKFLETFEGKARKEEKKEKKLKAVKPKEKVSEDVEKVRKELLEAFEGKAEKEAEKDPEKIKAEILRYEEETETVIKYLEDNVTLISDNDKREELTEKIESAKDKQSKLGFDKLEKGPTVAFLKNMDLFKEEVEEIKTALEAERKKEEEQAFANADTLKTPEEEDFEAVVSNVDNLFTEIKEKIKELPEGDEKNDFSEELKSHQNSFEKQKEKNDLGILKTKREQLAKLSTEIDEANKNRTKDKEETFESVVLEIEKLFTEIEKKINELPDGQAKKDLLEEKELHDNGFKKQKEKNDLINLKKKREQLSEFLSSVDEFKAIAARSQELIDELGEITNLDKYINKASDVEKTEIYDDFGKLNKKIEDSKSEDMSFDEKKELLTQTNNELEELLKKAKKIISEDEEKEKSPDELLTDFERLNEEFENFIKADENKDKLTDVENNALDNAFEALKGKFEKALADKEGEELLTEIKSLYKELEDLLETAKTMVAEKDILPDGEKSQEELLDDYSRLDGEFDAFIESAKGKLTDKESEELDDAYNALDERFENAEVHKEGEDFTNEVKLIYKELEVLFEKAKKLVAEKGEPADDSSKETTPASTKASADKTAGKKEKQISLEDMKEALLHLKVQEKETRKKLGQLLLEISKEPQSKEEINAIRKGFHTGDFAGVEDLYSPKCKTLCDLYDQELLKLKFINKQMRIYNDSLYVGRMIDVEDFNKTLEAQGKDPFREMVARIGYGKSQQEMLEQLDKTPRQKQTAGAETGTEAETIIAGCHYEIKLKGVEKPVCIKYEGNEGKGSRNLIYFVTQRKNEIELDDKNELKIEVKNYNKYLEESKVNVDLLSDDEVNALYAPKAAEEKAIRNPDIYEDAELAINIRESEERNLEVFFGKKINVPAMPDDLVSRLKGLIDDDFEVHFLPANIDLLETKSKDSFSKKCKTLSYHPEELKRDIDNGKLGRHTGYLSKFKGGTWVAIDKRKVSEYSTQSGVDRKEFDEQKTVNLSARFGDRAAFYETVTENIRPIRFAEYFYFKNLPRQASQVDLDKTGDSFELIDETTEKNTLGGKIPFIKKYVDSTKFISYGLSDKKFVDVSSLKTTLDRTFYRQVIEFSVGEEL